MTTFRANAIKKMGDPNPGFSQIAYIGYPSNPVLGPEITSITPATVYQNIPTPITILGRGFTGTTAIILDDNACSDVVVVDDNTITCVTATIPSYGTLPIWTEGDVYITTFLEVAEAATDKNITIDSVVPSSGDKSGGVLVTLYGTNIIDVIDVQINETSQDAVTMQYGFSLTFETTFFDVGTYDIVVTSAGNSVTVVGGYTAV